MAIGWTVGLLLLLVISSTINHRLRMPGEEAAYPLPGQLVTVNGHQLHVYAEGADNLTLVFLSGNGTTAICETRAKRGQISSQQLAALSDADKPEPPFSISPSLVVIITASIRIQRVQKNVRFLGHLPVFANQHLLMEKWYNQPVQQFNVQQTSPMTLFLDCCNESGSNGLEWIWK